MDLIEKKTELCLLFYFYHKLFTQTQQEYFNLYFINDYTYNEIAQNYNISKAAVYDQISKIIEKLYYYEESLKLKEKKDKREEIIKEIKNTNNYLLLDEINNLD